MTVSDPGGPILAIVWHSRTGASETIARCVAEGAGTGAFLSAAQDVSCEDLRAAQGYVFVCPENLGSLSGAMKEMFDRNYYPLLGQIEGRPYATIIAAGSDGSGAQRQLDTIVTGWRLKRVVEPMIVNFSAQTPEAIFAPKSVRAETRAKSRELGLALIEGIRAGIF